MHLYAVGSFPAGIIVVVWFGEFKEVDVDVAGWMMDGG